MTMVKQSAPFFIVGARRSGTTMLRLMLNNHPNLSVPFETGFIPVFYQKLADYGDLKVRDNLARLLRDISEFPLVRKGGIIQDEEAILSRPIVSYTDLVNAIFKVDAERKGKRRWGDKTPGYITEVDRLWKVFPGCYIVHLVRDGRDVALSLRTMEGWGSTHIPKVAQDWRWETTLVHKIGAILGEHYLEVRYEDLVLNPDGILRRICTFLNEPFHQDMLAFHVTAEREMPRESMKWHKNSVKPPDPGKVYMWKQQMSLADRILFEQISGPALEIFGYERENRHSTWGSRLKKIYYYTVVRW